MRSDYTLAFHVLEDGINFLRNVTFFSRLESVLPRRRQYNNCIQFNFSFA